MGNTAKNIATGGMYDLVTKGDPTSFGVDPITHMALSGGGGSSLHGTKPATDQLLQAYTKAIPLTTLRDKIPQLYGSSTPVYDPNDALSQYIQLRQQQQNLATTPTVNSNFRS